MKIVIFGKNGQLGKAVTEKLRYRDNVIAVSREDVDLENTIILEKFIQDHKPNYIINCAAFTSVDLAESNSELVHNVNAEAVKVMAQEAKKIGSVLVHFSTDYVFNGEKEGQYFETDPVSPINVYGSSKAAAEKHIEKIACNHLILRTGWLYGNGKANFPKRIIERLNQGEKCEIVSDCYGSPTSTSDLAHALNEMIKRISSRSDINTEILGTYHLAASGYTSWYEYAKLICEMGVKYKIITNINNRKIYPIKLEQLKLAAKRPKNCRLNCDKANKNFGIEMPDWRESFLANFNNEVSNA